MYVSFKNFELLRHQISTRIDRSIRDYASEINSNADTISSTIFSASFSLVITYVGKENGVNGLIQFVIFSVAYIIAFFAYRWLLKKARVWYHDSKRHGGAPSSREIKELIDNFDHIACDNNLIVRSFMHQYESESVLCLGTFEFYELLYYATVSANTTLSILDHSDTCINTLDEISRVDLHRIYNQLDMLKEAKEFLVNHCMDKRIYNNIGLLYKGGRLTESARLYITVLTNVYRGASNSTVFAEACLTACSIYWVAMYPGGALLL